MPQDSPRRSAARPRSALGRASFSLRQWFMPLMLLGIVFFLATRGVAQPLPLAQDAVVPPTSATADERERIPTTAWLIPFESMGRGEPITWIIVLCSIVAVTLIIQGFLRVRRDVILPEESLTQIEQHIQQKQYKELIEFTSEDDSFVSQALNPALKRAPSFNEMREALEAGVAEETAEQFRRLEYINILANIGPLLGLLGTVIGIMDAFLAMRRAGGAAEVGALAGGISTALGTTMLGLMLAIPCLICYGMLRNKADRLTQEGATLAEEFLLMIKPDGRGPVPPPQPHRPAPRTGTGPTSLPGVVPSATGSTGSRPPKPSPAP